MVAHMALALWPQIQSKRYTKLYKTVALFVLFLSLAYDVHTPPILWYSILNCIHFVCLCSKASIAQLCEDNI